MAEHDPNIRGLKREWLAARLFAVLTALLLIAVGVTALIYPSNSITGGTASVAADQRRAAVLAVCSAALSTTQGFGIVPSYTQLASDRVKSGGANRRYTCFAQTGAAKYQITFDLMCDDLADAKCINLYSVTQDGTGAIYQRH